MLLNKVEIYVPSVKCGRTGGIPVQLRDAWIAKVEGMFCDRFGGCTAVDSVGCYRCDDGSIQKEDVKILYAYCDSVNWPDNVAHVREMARQLRYGLVQECVAIVVAGVMEFVK